MSHISLTHRGGPAGAAALRTELATGGSGSEGRQATALSAIVQRLGADSAPTCAAR